MSQPRSDDAVEQIKSHLYAGRKIPAIKDYRMLTGAGLVDAKQFIEALEVELRRASPEKFTVPPGRQGCTPVLLCWLLVLGLAAALAVFS